LKEKESFNNKNNNNLLIKNSDEKNRKDAAVNNQSNNNINIKQQDINYNNIVKRETKSVNINNINNKYNKDNKENLKNSHSTLNFRDKFNHLNNTPINIKITRINFNSYTKLNNKYEVLSSRLDNKKREIDPTIEKNPVSKNIQILNKKPNKPETIHETNTESYTNTHLNHVKNHKSEEKLESSFMVYIEGDTLNAEKENEKFLSEKQKSLESNKENNILPSYNNSNSNQMRNNKMNNFDLLSNVRNDRNHSNLQLNLKKEIEDQMSKKDNHTVKKCKNYFFSSLNLNETNKEKLKSIIKNLQTRKTPISKKIQSENNTDIELTAKHKSLFYLGDSFNDLIESEYIIVKNNSIPLLFKEISFLFVSLLNSKKLEYKYHEKKVKEKQFIKFSYFTECEKKKKVLTINDDHLIKFSIDFVKIEKLKIENNLPFKGLKIFLHGSIFSENFLEHATTFNNNIPNNNSLNSSHINNEINKENYKYFTLKRIIQLIGGDLVDHIRLCDICIITKIDSAQYMPPHVKNLNVNFILEAIETLKLPDLENFKYRPRDRKYQKNRK